MNGHVSARLGIRFVLNTGELTVIGADGRPFLTPAELVLERAAAERAAAEAAAQAAAASAKAEAAVAKAETAEQRAKKLAEKLRELGIDPDAV